MKLNGNIASLLTAVAAVATSLAANQAVAEPWKTITQMVVLFVATLLSPIKKP